MKLCVHLLCILNVVLHGRLTRRDLPIVLDSEGCLLLCTVHVKRPFPCVCVCVNSGPGHLAWSVLCTHVCVFVVTVGGQEHLGYFIHSTQQERQLCLHERERTLNITKPLSYTVCSYRHTDRDVK